MQHKQLRLKISTPEMNDLIIYVQVLIKVTYFVSNRFLPTVKLSKKNQF